MEATRPVYQVQHVEVDLSLQAQSDGSLVCSMGGAFMPVVYLPVPVAAPAAAPQHHAVGGAAQFYAEQAGWMYGHCPPAAQVASSAAQQAAYAAAAASSASFAAPR